MRGMKERLIVATIVGFIIVGAFFLVFSPWLALELGYYLLLIDGLFAVAAVVFIRWAKHQGVK